MAETLSEYQAAQQFKLSPTLLRWLTSYDAKGDGKKLPYTVKSGIYYFNEKELADFDAHLRLPWPKPTASERPRIPTGIQQEIKEEAHFQCPVCNTNIGELAHIDPVARTFNNHPHNLIYLCSNHHTVYDFGHKYANIRREDVIKFKAAIQLFQSIRWGLQSQIVESYLSVIFKLGLILQLEAGDLKDLKSQEFEKIFELIVKKIKKVKDAAGTKAAVKEIIGKVGIKSKSKPREMAVAYASVQPLMTELMRKDKSLCECPLCDAKGYTSYFDICPVCDGEGFIDKSRVVDLDRYELEDCPLCDGRGHTSDFETCPPCDGEGKLTKEQIARVDFDKYELVDCPLCDGNGHTSDFETCPPCGGEGKVTRQLFDNIDLDLYEMVDCLLCKGRGHTPDFETCPPCGGEGKLTRQQITRMDFEKYELIDCPLCDGNGHTSHYETCPPCNGEGKVTRRQFDDTNLDDYELEKCPLCKGKGKSPEYETCPPCAGEGRLSREQINRIDWDQFE